MICVRYLCIALLALSVTACLKVTGAAKDPFDLEEEESNGFSTTIFSDQNPTESKSEPTQEQTNNGKPAQDKQSNTPAPSLSNSDQQEFDDFLKWKKERDADSAEYQEFREYQQYKLWLEFQKKQSQ